MTYARSGSTKVTSSRLGASTFVANVENLDRFRLCRKYLEVIDKINHFTTGQLADKHYLSPKTIRNWRHGKKPPGLKLYMAAKDPEYSNLSLMMSRYGISETTAYRARELRHGRYKPRRSRSKDTLVEPADSQWMSWQRKPSPLSPLLERWGR